MMLPLQQPDEMLIIVDFLEKYWEEMVVWSLLGFLILVLFSYLSQYYIFPKVYLIQEGGRVRRYIGRQIRTKQVKGEVINKVGSKKDDAIGSKKVKMEILLKETGIIPKFKKIRITEDIKVKQAKSSEVWIYAPNVKWDYTIHNAYIPTKDKFKAIAPTSNVMSAQILDKMDLTDMEVRKATNLNPAVSKYQKTSGSIPLSAGMLMMPGDEDLRPQMDQILENIERDKMGEDEDDDSKLSKDLAKEELEKMLKGGGM